MSYNTFPPNPFPPSSEQMDVLETEVSKLKRGLTNYETQNDLNLEVHDRKNLCNNDKNGVGYYDNEGTYQYNFHYATSDLIPVEQGKTYIASLFNKTTGERVSGLVYSTWDANKNFVAQSVNDSIAISSGVSYVRIRNFQSDITYIDDDNYVYQLEQGSTATAYAQYIPSVETRLDAVESAIKVSRVTVSPDANGYVNLSPSGFTKAGFKYVNAVVTGASSARSYDVRVWLSDNYGWVASIYTVDTFTKVTDTSVSLDLVVFGVAV